MTHVLGAPFHPQTQSKIERWRQTMKTAFFWKTTICPAISNARSGSLSNTTPTSAITRA